jgi:hypothetical protein
MFKIFRDAFVVEEANTFIYFYTHPNKFSFLPSPKGEGKNEGIHLTTYITFNALSKCVAQVQKQVKRTYRYPFLG